MLDHSAVKRLVDMQRRSYELLKWVAKAVGDGFISFDTAHANSSLPETAKEWILGHYLNIPTNARPAHDDLIAFCAFFSTYLQNSFDLISDPGKQNYSPDAHCFCPICSWFVAAPHLKAKKLSKDDKRRAQKMRVNALMQLAAHEMIDVRRPDLDSLFEGRMRFEWTSFLAYGYDLIQREKGIANGPAVLALWRGFAWTEYGSPKRGFRLKASMIIEAEERLLSLLKEISS